MKKTIVYVLLAMLVITGATAIQTPEVYCGEDKWYNPFNNKCEADEIQPVVDDLTDGINKAQKTANKAKKTAYGVETYVEENEAEWASDKRGVSMNRVLKYLHIEYKNYLKTLFAPKSLEQDVEDLQYQVNYLKKVLHYMSAGYTGIYEQGGFMYGTNPQGQLEKLG